MPTLRLAPAVLLVPLLASPAMADGPVAFSAGSGGYELGTPAGGAALEKEGLALNVEWDDRPWDDGLQPRPGWTPSLGDDTLYVEHTFQRADLEVSTRDRLHLDDIDPGVAAAANLRALRAEYPAFRFVRDAAAPVLDAPGSPVHVAAEENALRFGWGLGPLKPYEDELEYPAPESWWGVPVRVSDQQTQVGASFLDSSDAAIAALEQDAGLVCVAVADGTGSDTGAGSEACPRSPLSDAAGPLLPNAVLHSELSQVSVAVNPAHGPRAAPPASTGAAAVASLERGAPSARASPAGDERAPSARDEALPADVLGLLWASEDTGAAGAPWRPTAALASRGDPLAGLLVLAAGLGAVALAVPLYRRIARGRVLHHDVRGRILALVRENPGLHESAAAKTLGISHTLAQYHVRMLAEFGFVEVKRFGGRKHLFAAGQLGRAEKSLLLAEKGRGAQLVDLVAAQPGIAQRELARAMGVRESSVKWHLDRLEAQGVVLVARGLDGKRVRLSPETEQARLASFGRGGPGGMPPAVLEPWPVPERASMPEDEPVPLGAGQPAPLPAASA